MKEMKTTKDILNHLELLIEVTDDTSSFRRGKIEGYREVVSFICNSPEESKSVCGDIPESEDS